LSELDLLRDEDLRTEREEAREPAKRWRNWWRFNISALSFDGGTVYERGKSYAGPMAFPSREVAEQRALDKLARSSVTRRRTGRKERFAEHVEYLGAFPEGERPE